MQWVWKNGHFLKTVKFCFGQKTINITKSVKTICNLIWEFYALKNFTTHFTLCLIFRVWPYHSHIYIYIQYIQWMNLSGHEQVCLIRLFRKIQRYFSHHSARLNIWHDKFIVLWCTDKRKFIPYISATYKVLKSCRSTIAIWPHDVYDVHEVSSLYKKTCWQSSFIYVYVHYIYI